MLSHHFRCPRSSKTIKEAQSKITKKNIAIYKIKSQMENVMYMHIRPNTVVDDIRDTVYMPRGNNGGSIINIYK